MDDRPEVPGRQAAWLEGPGQQAAWLEGPE